MSEAELNLEELEHLLVGGSTLPEVSNDISHVPLATAATEPATHDRKKKKRREKHRKEKKRDRNGDNIHTDSDDEQRKRSRYVLDAAESTDGDDDDEFLDDDEEAEEGLDDGFRYEPRDDFIFYKGDDTKSADELGREYEERDRLMKSQKSLKLFQGLSQQKNSSLRYASHLLPQESDPKVFAVKCRPRMARILVTRIVNKCYAYRVGKNYEKKKVDLGIISVFCMDHVKDYIYVEAYRKLFVENALNGLEGLFRSNITVVNPTQLLQMMEKRSSTEKIRVGSFVRLRQRFYRLDLAQVTAIDQDGIHITCRVVPREDFEGKSFNKAAAPLPPHFFVPRRAVGAEDHGDHYRWGDLRFDKEGYLIKTTSSRMVIFGPKMEKPTAEELACFYNNNRERVREAIARTGDAASMFQIGDSIRVISGQLRETVGTIVNIFSNNNTALLSCPIPNRKEPINLRVELGSCVKHFAEGTHVIVEKGDSAGESGTVLRSWGDVVLLFLDRSSTETQIKVRANDCHQSKLRGALNHSFGTWQVFDLVTIAESNIAACIVGLTRKDVVVVTERNEVHTLTYAQIKVISVRGTRQTTDPMQNVLVCGSEVTIQRTSLTPFNLAGETGRIQQVYNRTIFLCCRRIRENAGMVALDASCVLLIGGRTTTKQAAMPKQLPLPLRRPHNATQADVPLLSNHVSADWKSNSEWYELPSHSQ